jgi:hypothetical protein
VERLIGVGMQVYVSMREICLALYIFSGSDLASEFLALEKKTYRCRYR